MDFDARNSIYSLQIFLPPNSARHYCRLYTVWGIPYRAAMVENIVTTLTHTRYILIVSQHHTLFHALTPTPDPVPAPADAGAFVDAPDDVPVSGSPHFPISTRANSHVHGYALFWVCPTHYHNLVHCYPSPNLNKTPSPITKLAIPLFSSSLSLLSFHSSVPL